MTPHFEAIGYVQTMLIAVDWAGDPGMKLGRGSLPRCIMAVIVCVDEEALRNALAELRHARSLRKDFEFHYTKLDDQKLKEQFMQAIASKVIATVAVYEKERMTPSWAWGRDTDLLVQLIIHCVLSLPHEVIKDAKMIIDGEREAKVLRDVLRPALSKALEERNIAERLHKIVPGSSASYDAIQVADMIGGAVNAEVKHEAKETHFLGAASKCVTVLRITPEMAKPTK